MITKFANKKTKTKTKTENLHKYLRRLVGRLINWGSTTPTTKMTKQANDIMEPHQDHTRHSKKALDG